MSAEFILDTDTVSFALRGVGNVGAALLSRRPSQVCVSSLTVAELRYGAERRRSRKLSSLIDQFMSAMTVAPFDQAAADEFGAVAGALARRGVPIGQIDTLIAAHALSLGVVLVTNNTRHFSRVKGLRVDNWT